MKNTDLIIGRRIIFGLTALILTVMAFTPNEVEAKKAPNRTYAETFCVTQVRGNEYTLMAFNGNEFIWVGEKNDEEYYVGDIVSAVMKDNRTKKVYDDTIVSIKYSGWVDKWGYDVDSKEPLWEE